MILVLGYNPIPYTVNNILILLSVLYSVGIASPIYGMGIAAGDYDKDMDLDYYFTNIGRNVLSQNLGNGFFMDTTDAANVGSEWVVVDSFKATGWGCGFIDTDNDSHLDLYVANGFIDGFPELQTSEIDR